MTSPKVRKLLIRSLQLIALFVVSLLIHSSYQYLTIGREKAIFQKVEGDIDTTLTEIGRSNTLLNIQKNKYCRNDQEEYGGGQLGCYVSRNFRIVVSQNERESKIAIFNQALKMGNFLQESPLVYKGDHDTGQFKNISTNTSCYPSYRIIDNNSIEFDFYCVRPARRAIFQKL